MQDIRSMIVLVLEKNSTRFFYESVEAKKIETIEIEMMGNKLNELVYG